MGDEVKAALIAAATQLTLAKTNSENIDSVMDDWKMIYENLSASVTPSLQKKNVPSSSSFSMN